ncbi:MAG: hypothetical protein ACREX3_22175 [Gammaproteobacteria bacterium]
MFIAPQSMKACRSREIDQPLFFALHELFNLVAQPAGDLLLQFDGVSLNQAARVVGSGKRVDYECDSQKGET